LSTEIQNKFWLKWNKYLYNFIYKSDNKHGVISDTESDLSEILSNISNLWNNYRLKEKLYNIVMWAENEVKIIWRVLNWDSRYSK
jgi:hypothetical protein